MPMHDQFQILQLRQRGRGLFSKNEYAKARVRLM